MLFITLDLSLVVRCLIWMRASIMIRFRSFAVFYLSKRLFPSTVIPSEGAILEELRSREESPHDASITMNDAHH